MLSHLIAQRRRGLRGRLLAVSASAAAATADALDDPEAALLADDLKTMEQELRHRDAYLRSLGAPSAESVARATMVTDNQMETVMANEGPLARFKDLYSINDDWEPSFELISLILCTAATFTYLNVRFTVQERRLAVMSFQERNKVTVFSTRQQASRRMTDYTTMRALRLGLKRSAGSLIFCPLFIGGAQVISAARGKSSPLDYAPSGCIAGAFVRSVHGLRPMIGGSVLGGLIGALIGSAVYGLSWTSGLRYEDMRRYQLTERAERDARLMARYHNVAKG